MAKILTPETAEKPSYKEVLPTMFVGGSIEMGKASHWQSEVEHLYGDSDVVLFNPRRLNWDSTWAQDISNPEFKYQVDWELAALEIADAILIHLEPGTMSPISMAEFAFYAGRTSTGCLNKVVVSCPVGFWRRGNIEIMAERYKIPFFGTMTGALRETEVVMRRNHERRTTTKWGGILD